MESRKISSPLRGTTPLFGFFPGTPVSSMIIIKPARHKITGKCGVILSFNLTQHSLIFRYSR